MRYLTSFIHKDLSLKMVFMTGPRQSGKTTLAKKILKKLQVGLYLNWDDADDRKMIMARSWFQEDKLIILDEIHKYSKWKNFIKGTFDKQREWHQFLITGSARLDIYKKGQDSLLGRFFSWRLHPLCLSELKHNMHDPSASKKNLTLLLERGGFPEPFFAKDPVFAKRWRKERINLIFRQDIQEIEKIRDIYLLEFFYQSLVQRVGSEIVFSNMARDLEIAPKTAKAWASILEKTYALFMVTPYSKNLVKAVVKAPKIYFYDNGEVEGDLGAKFENLVANHLLKRLHFLEDLTGDQYQLHYVRDQQGHKIDFLVVRNRKPVCLIDCKVSDSTPSRSLYYFRDKLKITHCLQLVMNLEKNMTRDNIKIIPALDWLSLPLSEDLFS